MTKWYLVRHGETLWNAEGRLQGQTDSPLSDAGRSQAKRVGDSLSTMSFDAMYSSDLGRTIETTEIVIRGLDLTIRKSVELREKSYGDWEGMRDTDVEKQFAESYKRLQSEDAEFAPPNGESDLDLVTRVGAFADRAMDAHSEDDNILIVAHGGTIRAMVAHLIGVHAAHMWRLVLSNCSISTVSFLPNGRVILDRWNDVSHMDGPS